MLGKQAGTNPFHLAAIDGLVVQVVARQGVRKIED